MGSRVRPDMLGQSGLSVLQPGRFEPGVRCCLNPCDHEGAGGGEIYDPSCA